MTRQEAKEILRHWDDIVWKEENHITMGDFADALYLAEQALENPTQEQFIDKACEYLDTHIMCMVDETRAFFIDGFRKAMTKTTNPLFKQALSNANPETRAEVRRNMDAVLLWHKVLEELPPVDTEVVCKMKGVPHTEHFVCKWDGRYWLHWGYYGKNIQGWFGLNEGWEVVEWKEI